MWTNWSCSHFVVVGVNLITNVLVAVNWIQEQVFNVTVIGIPRSFKAYLAAIYKARWPLAHNAAKNPLK